MGLKSFVSAVLLCLAAASHGAEPLPEIGRAVKAATAMWTAGPSTGTAFCIHPDGYFLCGNAALRQTDPQGIQLVFDTGSAAERSLPAIRVRSDEKIGLALLKVNATTPLPFIDLGRVGPKPGDEVVVAGYPWELPGTNEKRRDGRPAWRPPLHIRLARLSSQPNAVEAEPMRLTRGHPANGDAQPVLGMDGKCVGVLSLSRGQHGVLPVERFASFLEKPELLFLPPRLDPAKRDAPATFRAKVVRFAPATAKEELTLVLGDSAKGRAFPMVRDGDAYRADAPPYTANGPVDAVDWTIVRKVAGTEADRVSGRLRPGGEGDAWQMLAKGKFQEPGRAEQPTSYFKAVGSSKDAPGGGHTFAFAADKFTIHEIVGGLNIIGGLTEIYITLSAPSRDGLAVGPFDNAGEWPASLGKKTPGVSLRLDRQAVPKIVGKFAVWEIEKPDRKKTLGGPPVERLAVDFILWNEKTPGETLHGRIRYKSTFE